MSAVQALLRYMEAWATQDWQEMFDHTQLTAYVHKYSPARLETEYGHVHLMSYSVIDTREVSDVCVDFTADVRVALGDTEYDKRVTARVICEIQPYMTATEEDGGRWGVNPVSTKALRDR